jgi:hypothetical protein
MRRVAGAVLLIVAMVTAPSAGAVAAPPTGLSISIQSDRAEVHEDDSLTYTATVTNDGTEAVDGRLVITVPEYVRITDLGGADGSGVDASWTVTVAAGDSVTKTLSVRLDTIPEEELRVTTLVGFYLDDATEATIRSAHAAAIAGVEDPAHAVSDPSPQPTEPPALLLVGLGVGAAVVLAATATWLLLRRRRSSAS